MQSFCKAFRLVLFNILSLCITTGGGKGGAAGEKAVEDAIESGEAGTELGVTGSDGSGLYPW